MHASALGGARRDPYRCGNSDDKEATAMDTSNDRRAASAGVLGGLIWLFAFVGFVLGEIEYNDPTRVSPVPEWVSGIALSIGAVLIGAMLLAIRARSERGSSKAAVTVALIGTVLALVPLWPMIFFGPLLVGLGLAARGVIAIRKGEGDGAAWVHAVGVPIGMASGIGFDAVGSNNVYSGYVFGLALCAGLIWLGYDMMADDRSPAPLPT
jgi:hypothetical protein